VQDNNVLSHLSKNTASHLMRLESSATQLYEVQSVKCCYLGLFQ